MCARIFEAVDLCLAVPPCPSYKMEEIKWLCQRGVGVFANSKYLFFFPPSFPSFYFFKGSRGSVLSTVKTGMTQRTLHSEQNPEGVTRQPVMTIKPIINWLPFSQREPVFVIYIGAEGRCSL